MTEFTEHAALTPDVYERKDNVGPDDLTKAPTGAISTDSLMASVPPC